MEKTKLKDLSPGETALIAGYEAGNAAYRGKLLSMGLTKGTEITLIKIAPMGDPVEIDVRGFHLSLRKDEAEVLLLKRES